MAVSQHRKTRKSPHIHHEAGQYYQPLSAFYFTEEIDGPANFFASGGVRHESITKQWKGASKDDHATERSKKGDTHDINSDASASGMKEREQSEGIADKTKSQGMTQRGGTEGGKKAKAEHPAAPEPVIGMNDERAQVRTD
ncbi:uncharacterized protein N7484_002347 [Penicillium longicatenatum]|uniref:uncharacterized protein n=1 Tax=Penicillium longicatenatum TaxID=1561947 RepID=UPI00254710C8|nr:uncharacterized protein N7484_002347 [Penicillium longicatenatum]KAJ5658698.1 hypothetical protein N7484_002347 [Penicillium longicatenatum]